MKIPILHLEDGTHHFDDVVKGGTQQFYHSDLYPGDIFVSVDLNKFGFNITCNVTVKTVASVNCDRCLAPFNKQVKEQFELLFYLGQKKLDAEEEDVIQLSPEVKEIDIAPYIQEMLILAVPMKQLCDQNCRGICAGCGVNLNKEKCKCPSKPVDSRWEKLIELKKQKN
jgi:uncharacterized protein